MYVCFFSLVLSFQGIGADDIFIFVDAWKQSEIEVPAPGMLAGAASVH